MSEEMWSFLVVLLFFALVLVASHWFVLLPDHWTMRRKERGREGSGGAGTGSREETARPRRTTGGLKDR